MPDANVSAADLYERLGIANTATVGEIRHAYRLLLRRFTPERKLVSPFWLVPVKDLLQAALWLCAFAGNTVEWRGREMKLRRDGTLVEKN